MDCLDVDIKNRVAELERDLNAVGRAGMPADWLTTPRWKRIEAGYPESGKVVYTGSDSGNICRGYYDLASDQWYSTDGKLLHCIVAWLALTEEADKAGIGEVAQLTVNELFAANVSRCLLWHPGGLEEWSALEWAGAMAGEAGEAANAAKKLKRVESKLQNINAPGRSLIDVRAAQEAVACEVADTFLYGLLLMARVGVADPAVVIAKVFNRKSEEYGFPQLLPLPERKGK